jgi:hypothetical protein
MKKLFVLISILFFLTTVTAFAAGNSNTGCGLGSLIIEKQDSILMQILAATTNGTSGSQTFGITSGTSNCDKPSKFAENDELQEFVADNMDELAMDISNGQGEVLETVAKLMNVEDIETFSKNLKENFSDIYPNEEVSSAHVIDTIAKYI